MSETKNVLFLCQRFIECVETKDISGVEETLAEDARQIFRHTKQVTKPGMFDQVSSGKYKGVVVAILKGKSEILAYTKGLILKHWIATSPRYLVANNFAGVPSHTLDAVQRA